LDLTKTSNLVIFIVLISVGIGAASALGTTIVTGDFTVTGDSDLQGNVDIGGTLTGVEDCNSALALFEFVPDFRLPPECAPVTVPATLIVPGTGLSCTGDNCFSVLTDFRRFVTGNLENTDPQWTRPISCLTGAAGTQFYDEWVLLVDVPGTYELTLRAEPDDYSGEDAVFDAYLFVYSPIFTAGTPLTNCIDANDDDGFGASLDTDSELTVALTTDSRVVVSSFNNLEVGHYNLLAERLPP